MRSTVQRHTMLVEYAEHGTSACEAADGKDVIYAVPLVVHVHDILLTLQFRQCFPTSWAAGHSVADG